MPKFRKKAIVVEAEQFFPDKNPWPKGVRITSVADDAAEIHARNEHGFFALVIDDRSCLCSAHMDVLGGAIRVCPGDWIITGIKGEKYPCKDEIFGMTYEPVDESAQVDPDTIAREAAERVHYRRYHGMEARRSHEITRTTLIIRAAIDKATYQHIQSAEGDPEAEVESAAIDIAQAIYEYAKGQGMRGEALVDLHKKVRERADGRIRAAIDKALAGVVLDKIEEVTKKALAEKGEK